MLMALAAQGASAQARYVFYFIGDGMGMGHINAAQYYWSHVRGADEPLLMMQFPNSAIVTTRSANSPVTDSAASGTALASGHKTLNYMVGLAPDSITPLTSIATQLKNRGWGVGLATSVSADDATPAAFYAHQNSRNNTYAIAREAAGCGFDFLAGSGLHGLVRDGKVSDIMEHMERAGYKVSFGTDGVRPGESAKLLVLGPTPTPNIGYTIDSIAGAARLDEFTRLAIEHLKARSPERFFLMVEGGNIDHAGHANDGGAIIKEVVAFQDAIRQAYDFYLEHPDETIIVITADHDTSGFAIAGKKDLSYIDSQRMSKSAFQAYCRGLLDAGTEIDWDGMKAVLADKFGFWTVIPVSEKYTAELQGLFDKTFKARAQNDQKGLYDTFNAFAVRVFEVLSHYAGMSYAAPNHTGNPVPALAIGRGTERINGVIDNTAIPKIILEVTEK